MALKVLTKFSSNNNDYIALHKVKLSGVKNGTGSVITSHATTTGEVDLSPIFPAVSTANAGKALVISSEGDRLAWGEAGKLDGVQINGVDLTITNKKVNIPVASNTTFGVVKYDNILIGKNSNNQLTLKDGYADTTAIAASNVHPFNKVGPTEFYAGPGDSEGYPMFRTITVDDLPTITASQLTDGTKTFVPDYSLPGSSYTLATTDDILDISINGTAPISVAMVTSEGSKTFTISHDDTVGSTQTYGSTTAQTPVSGGTFVVPYITVDAKGHATAGGTTNVTIPQVEDEFVKVEAQSSANLPLIVGMSQTPTANQAQHVRMTTAKSGWHDASAMGGIYVNQNRLHADNLDAGKTGTVTVGEFTISRLDENILQIF